MHLYNQEFLKKKYNPILYCSLSFLFLLIAGIRTNVQSQLKLPFHDSLLDNLRVEHPRLLATDEDFNRIARLKETDAYVKEAFQQLYDKGVGILSDTPAMNPPGRFVLAVPRKILDRVSVLGFLYRITKESRFAERAWLELYTASRFPDWNPYHFLDVGEMTFAFALGYDWLYEYWNPVQKRLIKSAITEKGLFRALSAFEGLTATRQEGWWSTISHNWNQVCNGGIGIGALAIIDEDPALSVYIIKQVLKRLPNAMRNFGPDGAWNEGPNYWRYATKYNVAIIAALRTALGSDFGLAEIDGFLVSGLFPLYMNSPLNKSYNFADGAAYPLEAAQNFWFARQLNQPNLARFEYGFKPADPFALLWYDADLVQAPPKELPTDKYFRGTELAVFRSAWNDPQAAFAGVKAGDNKANHSHLDLGSFVFDVLGERWLLDLGEDSYGNPGYFRDGRGGQRWTYYRMRAEGHNTLLINPDEEADQDPEAATHIVDFKGGPEGAYAIMDLTPAYARHSSLVKRGIALDKKKMALTIEDEVENKQPSELYWFAHTGAAVTLSGDKRSASLIQNGKKLTATLVYPRDAKFECVPAIPLPSSPHPMQNNPNEGVRKLRIHLKDVIKTRIKVVFHPEAKAENAYSIPMEKWTINDYINDK